MKALRRLTGTALLALPGTVLAHSPIKGLDNFYAGLLHPLFVPSHFLAALALGILFGQRGTGDRQRAILAFLGAVLVGLTATRLRADLVLELPLLAAAATIGVLVALDRPLPAVVYTLLAAAVGLMIGGDSAQGELTGRGLLAAFLGTLIAAYMLLLYAAMLAEFFSKRPWQRIGLRILGSWAAASALLVLSLALAK